jgi:hypothetical protein
MTDFNGLAIGRIVHAFRHLANSEQTLVERPAIVTSVVDKVAGIVNLRIFDDPTDPPGTLMFGPKGTIADDGGGDFMASGEDPGTDAAAGIPSGVNFRHGAPEGRQAGTWHWPERD